MLLQPDRLTTSSLSAAASGWRAHFHRRHAPRLSTKGTANNDRHQQRFRRDYRGTGGGVGNTADGRAASDPAGVDEERGVIRGSARGRARRPGRGKSRLGSEGGWGGFIWLGRVAVGCFVGGGGAGLGCVNHHHHALMLDPWQEMAPRCAAPVVFGAVGGGGGEAVV